MLYLDYQNVCPFVIIGSPHSPASNCAPPPPRNQGGGGGNSNSATLACRMQTRGQGEPIRTTGKKAKRMDRIEGT